MLADSQEQGAAEEDPAMDKKKKKEYLRRFLSVSTLRRPDPKIAKVSSALLSLPLRLATPCSLILDELINLDRTM